MDPARFRRLMALVGEAIQMPPERGDAWLGERCGSDPELLEEARSLVALSRTGSADGLTMELEAGVAREAAQVSDAPRPLPERIGPYLIREILGEGGMGIVYGGRQEEPIQRDVAVKVVRAGLFAPTLLARFEVERRTLASLDHPGIAHVFDAGSTEEGLPWVAMERVRGQPLTQFCNDRGLSLRERLTLFQQVLAAVQHAHQKAVVHRDLKPSNVLVVDVDGVPFPKVIDFGVARVTSDALEAAPARTAVGTVVGTLEYMSPEQAISPGKGVDTRSDIYSLGVMLYELLTGALPFPGDALRSATPGELERILGDTEPPTASRRVATSPGIAAMSSRAGPMTPARLSRALRGDLDNILGMALRKDPAQRYQSAAEFREDLQRYLEGRPVRARPATLTYRTRRFVGRHKAGVFGTAATVALLVAVTGIFTGRLADERDRARMESATAEEVSSFMQRLFEVSDPSEALGEAVTARELLDAGADYVEGGLSGQPEVQARMMRVIGDAYRGLGLLEQAHPLLKAALERHLELYGPDHGEVAASQIGLGHLLTALGDPVAAEALHREALATRRQLHGPDHPAVAGALGALARTLEEKADVPEAEERYREAIDLSLRHLPPDHPDVALLQVRLGAMLRLHGRFDEAEPLLREGLAAQRAHHGDRHPRLATGVRHLGALLREQGDYQESAALYQEAVAIRRALLGDDHPDLAATLSSYGLLLRMMGESDLAIAALREAVDIVERTYQEPHPHLGHSLHNLALELGRAGRRDEARALFERAVQVHELALPQGHPDRAHSILGLAWIHMDEDRAGEAEPFFREALAIRREALPPDHRDVGGALSDLGECLRVQGRYAEAEPLLLEAHGILVASEGASGRRASRAAGRLVQLYEGWGRAH